jgi:FdhD protein
MTAQHSSLHDLFDVTASTTGCEHISAGRFEHGQLSEADETLAVEEPLEISLTYGLASARVTQPISVTMRTPGHDAELAAGFLLTEGVIRDPSGIASTHSGPNSVTVELHPDVDFNLAVLKRNFYTTSSCGICGKASLLAMRTVCPPRSRNTLTIQSSILLSLPARLRSAQGIFDQTGGLHAAGLFTSAGALDSVREDVGRHNAVDKLIGAALLAERLPLRDRLLLLSGRASFELLQKAVMAGIPMVASVGAPSSLAVRVAREFDVTLIGFLRRDHFNIYHAAQRVLTA